MKLIKQRNGVDCGLAVAAMLASTTYKHAAECDPDRGSNKGLSITDFRWLMIGLTGKYWHESRRSYRVPLSLANVPKKSCAILIRRAEDKFGHWVAFDGNLVFDSEIGTVKPIAEYERRDWLVIRIFTVDVDGA